LSVSISSRAVSKAPCKEPVEILTPEAKAAAIAELRGWNRALPRPSADRLLAHEHPIEHRFWSLHQMCCYHVTVVTESPRRWLLLLYTVPREPSVNRVSVWRKLKRLGAVLLHDAVWVLPPSPRAIEELRWLAAEIRERGGEAMLWEASLGLDLGDNDLVRQFLGQVDCLYTEILSALEDPAPDLASLSKRYQQARLQDYFHSPLGERVREALLSAGGRAER
jgi:hypothetical protein